MRVSSCFAAWAGGLLCLLVALSACTGGQRAEEVAPPKAAVSVFSWDGEVFGTTFRITAHPFHVEGKHRDSLRQGVDMVFDRMNAVFSTYQRESEISRFNALPAGESLQVSPDFQIVLELSRAIHTSTGGAFDPTVGPLVDLWGFHNSGQQHDRERTPPSKAALTEARTGVGFEKLRWHGAVLHKDLPGMRLDLNAIAKGYAVDQVGKYLTAAGVQNFMVEVGGEMVLRGTSPKGLPWHIGIDRPVYDESPGAEIETILALRDVALATSGDYRNYFKYGKDVFSHFVDPRTGRPTQSRLASVTIVGPTCALADAAATAVSVMGAEAGLSWLEKQQELEGLLYVRTDTQAFQRLTTSGWAFDVERE